MHFPLRKCYYVIKVGILLFLIVTIITLFEQWRGGKRTARAQDLELFQDKFEKEVREDEARIIPGLGEGGVAARLVGEAKRLGEESEKALAINVYLSDRIAYNRTLKDYRNPACQRVVYDAELPSASVILIFHNEPYSVVVRTIWSVLNSARRSQPWYKRANYVDRSTGKTMNLGYPGQDKNSPFVYLKEIILVDDNSTLPELKGKLSHYIRTRLPPDLIRIIRLPDRVGLIQARLAGSREATSDVLVFLDSHCEPVQDWLRPMLQRVKENRTAVVTPIIDMLESDTLEYQPGNQDFEVTEFSCRNSVGLTRARLAGARFAEGDVLVFLDAHCEGQTDWLRPMLQRIKDSPKSVVVPIIDVIESGNFHYSVQDLETFQAGSDARPNYGRKGGEGDVLIFLDAHCEGEADWLRPLLQRIQHKRDAVLTPLIDVIDQTTFQLEAAEHFQVGGFTFMGHFTWIEVPEREKKRRGSDIDPTWSPTMAGGLFAMNRDYYWELGAYDEQMAGWGGENLEMSFRIWQCGGTLETVPCSRVGHVFRSFHPYGLPPHTDTHGINTARMAEVWMDDYAELFYLHRPDLRKSPKIGDVTHRRILREKLHCKSFQWYLDHVYKEKFVPVRDVYGFGRFQNPASGLCLDTLQREGEATPLGVYPCHDTLQATQYLSLSLSGELRDEEKCAELQYARRVPEDDLEGDNRRVLMVTCHNKDRGQKWRYLESKQLQHIDSLLCLEAGAQAGSDVSARRCRQHSPAQRWVIDYSEDNDFRTSNDIEPSDQELRLQRLRGQRRKSRSLLSYETENEVHKLHSKSKRHGRKTKKKNKKKVTKNKFILTLVRTLMNNTDEHLETEIYCKHARLYPNNTFVRDLVTILNNNNIKVVNNGRVFERNKVTELGKGNKAEKVLKKMDLRVPLDQSIMNGVTPATLVRSPNGIGQIPVIELPKQPWRHGKKLKPGRLVEEEQSLIQDADTPNEDMNVFDPAKAQSKMSKIIVEEFVEVKQQPKTEAPRNAIKKHKRKRKGTTPTTSPLYKADDIEEAPLAELNERASQLKWSEDYEAYKKDMSDEREGAMMISVESGHYQPINPPHANNRVMIQRLQQARPLGRSQELDLRSHGPYLESGNKQSPLSKSPVKLVMKSNVTFNLGDEFFNWRRNGGDVTNLLGELGIPINGSHSIVKWKKPVRTASGLSIASNQGSAHHNGVGTNVTGEDYSSGSYESASKET